MSTITLEKLYDLMFGPKADPRLEYITNIDRGRPIYGYHESGCPLHLEGGLEANAPFQRYLFEGRPTPEFPDYGQDDFDADERRAERGIEGFELYSEFYAAALLGYDNIDFGDEKRFNDTFRHRRSSVWWPSDKGYRAVPVCVFVDEWILDRVEL